MENSALKKLEIDYENNPAQAGKPWRKRNMTTLKLQWLAERVRRCRQIQQLIADGKYQVESREVAKALLNLDS